MIQPVERRQIMSYDRVIKTRAWRSLLLVNPRGDAEVNGLLAFCPRLEITLVWDPAFLAPKTGPTEPVRRQAVLARLLVTAKANPRLRVYAEAPLVAAAGLAAEQLAGELGPFSGCVLACFDEAKPLWPQLRAWGALIEPTHGALMGKQIDLNFRKQVSAAGVVWRPWQNNLWLIDAKQLQAKPGPAAEIHRADRALPSPPSEPVSRETPPFEIRPRTRPVWETLEANLGLQASGASRHPVASVGAGA